MITVALTGILAFIVDRLSKFAVLKWVFGLSQPVTDKFGKTVPVIDGIFHLTYCGNTGMAWGMLAGKKTLLISLCIAILCVMTGLFIYYKPKSILLKIAVGFVMGGAVGNIYDRLAYGFVIDFLDFRIINYPVFNIADSFIVIGAVLLCIYVIFFDKKEDKIGNK